MISGRERFNSACRNANRDVRPPIWLMRQAGRALPEYRELKLRHDFLEIVHTPELAVEATLQPVRRFGMDAAVIFSDILVVPEALGQGYRFKDAGGISMTFPIQDAAALAKLSVEEFDERTEYLMSALRLARSELGAETALLGFAGSPWTLAAFMIEGEGTRTATSALALRRAHPMLFDELMALLTESVTRLLLRQIEAGADAVQIFDTLAGTLSPDDYWQASGRWSAAIIQALADYAPVILFEKGGYDAWDDILRAHARALSLDHTIELSEVRKRHPELVLQGNLDPELLRESPDTVREKARALLDSMKGDPGFIFNLGHGVLPDSRIETIAELVRTVQEYN